MILFHSEPTDWHEPHDEPEDWWDVASDDEPPAKECSD